MDLQNCIEEIRSNNDYIIKEDKRSVNKMRKMKENEESVKGRVYSCAFDFVITGDDLASVEEARDRIMNEVELIEGIRVVGNPNCDPTSWSKEEYGLSEDVRKNHSKRNLREAFVVGPTMSAKANLQDSKKVVGPALLEDEDDEDDWEEEDDEDWDKDFSEEDAVQAAFPNASSHTVDIIAEWYRNEGAIDDFDDVDEFAEHIKSDFMDMFWAGDYDEEEFHEVATDMINAGYYEADDFPYDDEEEEDVDDEEDVEDEDSDEDEE